MEVVPVYAGAFTHLPYGMHCLTAMLVDREKGFVCGKRVSGGRRFLPDRSTVIVGSRNPTLTQELVGQSRLHLRRPCLTSIASAVRFRAYLVLLE